MEDMPIDIHYNKLSDWLVKRRHCKANWQESAIKIREKINTAIQDMPAHDEITSLLTGTYINYFHCLRIIEILKTTEANSKNIFGSYSSQRMKDWQEVVQLYKVDCVYLAEAAQMLSRNVNYELPALKRQVAKCVKSQQDSLRKEAEYSSLSADFRGKYADMCQQYGIEGRNVKRELLLLAADLSNTYNDIANAAKSLLPSLNYYTEFINLINSGHKTVICPLLRTVIQKGNITTYEWRNNRPPTSSIDSTCFSQSLLSSEKSTEEEQLDSEIDWGAIDFGEDVGVEQDQIDFGDNEVDIELNEQGNAELTIQWDEADTTEVCDDAIDDGVARGKDALTVLDNPATRFQFMDELIELELFLSQRLEDMTEGTDVIVLSLIQSAPLSLQISHSDLRSMMSKVREVNLKASSPKLQQLMSIRNSPRYVERVTEDIIKLLSQSDKMAATGRLMILKREEAAEEEKVTKPKISLVKEKTLELKRLVEKEISTKYKNRIVNIMGEINSM